MLCWDSALKLAHADLYLDSRDARSNCFISHAHSDHLGVHSRSIATPATVALATHRLGAGEFTAIEYRTDFAFDRDTRLKLLPAGHILGSAMLRVVRPEGSLLYTGDFKLRPGLTVEQAQPERSDFLLMESTYGLPMFRFPPADEVSSRLVDLVAGAIRDGRQPIVMGYSLGKAQEITKILTSAGIVVTLHGAVHSLSGIYEQFGVALGYYRRYAFEDFHGPRALDLAERGALIAPPRVARTSFVSRFNNPCRIMMTGWAVLKNSIYRYGVDHALPLSDHADFDELLELIERVRPRKIYTHHGYKQFVDTLRARGHDAELARADEQMQLFD